MVKIRLCLVLNLFVIILINCSANDLDVVINSNLYWVNVPSPSKNPLIKSLKYFLGNNLKGNLRVTKQLEDILEN